MLSDPLQRSNNGFLAELAHTEIYLVTHYTDVLHTFVHYNHFQTDLILKARNTQGFYCIKKVIHELYKNNILHRFKIVYGKRSRWNFRSLDLHLWLNTSVIDINECLASVDFTGLEVKYFNQIFNKS